MLTDIICGEDACPVDIMFIKEPLLAIGCREIKNCINMMSLVLA